ERSGEAEVENHDNFTSLADRFIGFTAVYDAFRPRPPLVLLDILTQLAETPRPALVVDLGTS
ncbi:MAG: hypothetical protein WCD26_24090, partial [Pseudolabrys sp.]